MSRATVELISHPLCPFVHRAAALLTEYGVEFESRHIDLQNKPAWFLEISPRGKVPVLRIDGVTLFESNVILEYVAEVFAPTLVAGNALERARRRMWMTVADDLLATNYRIAVAATRKERETTVAAARDSLSRFETLLAPAANDNAGQSRRGPFVEGDAPGLVDFAAGPGLVRFAKLRRELSLDVFEGLPLAKRWCEAICARPAFTETLVEDFDERFHAFVRHDVAA